MGKEKTAGLEELIEVLKKPIEIKSKTLGILNFKHIYHDDYLFIEKCLNEEIDQEIFCKQFLINQINEPILTLKDFNDVSDDEIYSILKKYIEVEDLEEYFDFNNPNDIFTIFKEGMKSYRNYHHSSLLKTVNSLINSLNFHEELSFSIGTMSKTTKVLTGINQLTIPDISNHVSQVINSSAIQFAVNSMEIVKQQTAIWQKWINNNSIFLNQITKDVKLFWDNFQRAYQISSLDAQKCLKKYNWFISPNMGIQIVHDVIEVCNSSSKHKQKRINDIFINYFLENDYENLDIMVDKWSTNSLFKNRIKIIKDCVNIMKISGKDINYSNFVVPTLISQIDGIRIEIMKNGAFDSDHDKISKNDYFRGLTSGNEFYDDMNHVFLEVLFQNVYPGEKCKLLHFSRHKIIHGEITNYGRKDFTVRCFMILDFLSELTFINDNE